MGQRRGGAKRTAHPGQEHASRRKRMRQKENRVRMQERAEALGISVTELEQRLATEARDIRVRSHELSREFGEKYPSRGWGYY